MTELLTSAQMRAVEKAAIASGEVTGLDLMERAGQGVVQAIFAEWPELDRAGGRAVVLCGPGNNGGDGFVVARLLAEKGWTVEVFLYGDPDKLPPDAWVNYERWGAANPLPRDGLAALEHADLVVDALFGIGLRRPLIDLRRVLRDICDCCDGGRGQSLAERWPHFPPVVAIDNPSGICADSGRALQDASTDKDTISSGACAINAAADLTVTFHSAKPGHVLARGPYHCGRVVVVDIGLGSTSSAANRQALAEAVPGLEMTGAGSELVSDNVTRHLDRNACSFDLAKRAGHKFSHGHALILSGGVGRGGAARLAARGALRIGAGLVTVGCPPAALLEHASALDAIMARKVTDLAEVLEDDRINALCVGPGLGVSDDKRDLVAVALKSGRALVLDADALTLIGRDTTLFGLLHDRCVLTPHGGEFARLFPDIAAKLAALATTGPAYSKVDATRDAAKRAGCVVLFKGADTVIAHPDGRCAINASAYDRAAPWLATAGSGDVLAGFITGLLARGFAPQQAAETGAWLHTEAARSFGPGLIAEDLPEELPKVFRALGL
ncbi:NAD(P)H-hydrate dehydratase [Yoonia sp. R2331]|uniref:NAD(P)H-hydrate dehydratase n=1 Tax=Yoonia sp. R2331 TaxID=3237238 RepID=UPI0034E4E7E5